MSEYLQNAPQFQANKARNVSNALYKRNGLVTDLLGMFFGSKAEEVDTENTKKKYAWQKQLEQERAQNQLIASAMADKRAQARQQAEWERADAVALRNRGWEQEDAKTARDNALADTLRSWQREDSLAAQKQKREDALAQQKRAWAVEDRDAGYQHDMAKFLATYQQKQNKEQEALDKAAQAKAQSEETARRGLAELQGVADRGNIGAWTRWRQGMGLLGDEAEQDLGKQSAALAAIAPAAISKLKEAGVSGVNSLPEFMTYIGLGEDPTSEQIAGALPIIANTLGFSDPAIPAAAVGPFPATNGVAPAAGAPAPQPVPQAYAKYGL